MFQRPMKPDGHIVDTRVSRFPKSSENLDSGGGNENPVTDGEPVTKTAPANVREVGANADGQQPR